MKKILLVTALLAVGSSSQFISGWPAIFKGPEGYAKEVIKKIKESGALDKLKKVTAKAEGKIDCKIIDAVAKGKLGAKGEKAHWGACQALCKAGRYADKALDYIAKVDKSTAKILAQTCSCKCDPKKDPKAVKALNNFLEKHK